MIFVFYIIFTIIVASIGSSRKIGFFWSLVASIFLSPIIGIIIVLCSTSNATTEMMNLQKKVLKMQLGEEEPKIEQPVKTTKSDMFTSYAIIALVIIAVVLFMFLSAAN